MTKTTSWTDRTAFECLGQWARAHPLPFPGQGHYPRVPGNPGENPNCLRLHHRRGIGLPAFRHPTLDFLGFQTPVPAGAGLVLFHNGSQWTLHASNGEDANDHSNSLRTLRTVST